MVPRKRFVPAANKAAGLFYFERVKNSGYPLCDGEVVHGFLNESEKEEKNMSGIMMMVIAIVVLGGAYIFYGRYLEEKMGH